MAVAIAIAVTITVFVSIAVAVNVPIAYCCCRCRWPLLSQLPSPITAAVSFELLPAIAVAIALAVGHCRLCHHWQLQLPWPLAITVAVAVGHFQELLPWHGKNSVQTLGDLYRGKTPLPSVPNYQEQNLSHHLIQTDTSNRYKYFPFQANRNHMKLSQPIIATE
jgi:hypothetical protein